MPNYRTICINLKQLIFCALACAIYLPERSGEGKRRILEKSFDANQDDNFK